mmetsp:Transcript_44411/g.110493  ORF Transcript_44411/g.110493 Transcript_44411/m.110493 type:complete len:215 (-) Transcript_44411:863-1507(-)
MLAPEHGKRCHEQHRAHHAGDDARDNARLQRAFRSAGCADTARGKGSTREALVRRVARQSTVEPFGANTLVYARRAHLCCRAIPRAGLAAAIPNALRELAARTARAVYTAVGISIPSRPARDRSKGDLGSREVASWHRLLRSCFGLVLVIPGIGWLTDRLRRPRAEEAWLAGETLVGPRLSVEAGRAREARLVFRISRERDEVQSRGIRRAFVA